MKKTNTLRTVFYILMTIQIVLSCAWIGINFPNLPLGEERDVWQGLITAGRADAGHNCLYLYFLRLLTRYLPQTVPYAWVVMGIQCVFSFFAIFMVVRTVDTASSGRRGGARGRVGFEMLITLFLMTTPVIALINVSLDPASLALSFLVLMLAALTRIVLGSAGLPAWYIIACLAGLLAGITTPGMLYLVFVLMLLAFVMTLIAQRHAINPGMIIGYIVITLIAFIGAREIRHVTEGMVPVGPTLLGLAFSKNESPWQFLKMMLAPFTAFAARLMPLLGRMGAIEDAFPFASMEGSLPVLARCYIIYSYLLLIISIITGLGRSVWLWFNVRGNSFGAYLGANSLLLLAGCVMAALFALTPGAVFSSGSAALLTGNWMAFAVHLLGLGDKRLSSSRKKP